MNNPKTKTLFHMNTWYTNIYILCIPVDYDKDKTYKSPCQTNNSQYNRKYKDTNVDSKYFFCWYSI